MNRDFIKGIVVGFLFSIVAIYSFFRIYWIMEIGLKYFRWHALLWLYLFIAFIFFIITYAIYKTNGLKNTHIRKAYLIALGIFFGWYIAEGFLRITTIGKTYTESREGVYVNPAERMQKTWYKVRRPNEKATLKNLSEFSYPRTTNSLGLSDREWPLEKDSNEIRLITLGDSFTEGDGCAFDSTYPNVLQRLLQEKYPARKINVMNAGNSGSDPWFEYKKLTDLLLKYQPDIVVYTNGTNDMYFDHLNYGGLERFARDSSVTNRIPQPKWLGIYEVSYVFRLAMNSLGYDHTLFSKEQREENKRSAIIDARYLSSLYSKLAIKHNFKCVQVVRPDKIEIQVGKYEFPIDTLLLNTDTLPNFFSLDLLTFYKDTLKINKTNVDDYFWVIDGHHNAKGYKAMAKGVFSAVEQMINSPNQ